MAGLWNGSRESRYLNVRSGYTHGILKNVVVWVEPEVGLPPDSFYLVNDLVTKWPLTPKIDTVTWAFLKFDMRHVA